MKKLKIENLTAITDTREQTPFQFKELKTESQTLTTGDYSVAGFEQYICVERKSLSDLISCITTGRERFERELLRMKSYSKKIVVCEGSWTDIVTGKYRSKVTPKAVQNSIISFINRYGVPFHFCGSRVEAAAFTEQFLFDACKKFHEMCQKFDFEKPSAANPK